ncbi:hypothetical protein ACFWUQ_02960 [Streptomyces sp. NPDC058662]|uniref:hypothetical protein n=1 Tax=Streptomyces sp. NPDC058662 TaxID=3346583 RepID=UPI00364F91E8
MTLTEGRRVRLATDTKLFDSTGWADDASPEPVVSLVGSLSLAAGTEGTVERVVEERPQSEGVREFARLTSLLDSFGSDMPTESRRRLEEQIASLRPEWREYEKRGPSVTVRVRLDNGFVLDDVPDHFFTAL